MIYLLSYNHSGNTWFRYCVEYLTKRPTYGHRKFSISERDNNFLKIKTKKSPILIKRHELKKGEISSSDTVILLLRKPNHCIKRNKNIKKESLKYYKLINIYKNHKGIKYLFYYNELFNIKFINRLIKLFYKNIDYNILPYLKNNWYYHKAECLKIYNNPIRQKNCFLKDIPKKLLKDNIVKGIK